jgi:ankyrin repeat domain-containing protein 50
METLEAFPSKIEEVYLQTWRRILAQKASHVSTAKALLVWVLYAEQPITIEALEHALAISPNTHRFEPGRVVPGAILIALCRGLVTLEEESRVVRLVRKWIPSSIAVLA